MKNQRLFDMRQRANADKKLSSTAYRLLERVILERWNKDSAEDGEFPLTWRNVEEWLGLGENQSYRLIRELEGRAYIKQQSIRVVSDPRKRYYSAPQAYFIFVHQSPKNGGKLSLKNAGKQSPKNGGNHIYKSLRDKNSDKEGEKRRSLKGLSAEVNWDAED